MSFGLEVIVDSKIYFSPFSDIKNDSVLNANSFSNPFLFFAYSKIFDFSPSLPLRSKSMPQIGFIPEFIACL